MGVRTLLTELRNLVTGKSFEVWEEEDGELSATLGDRNLVVSETNPVTGGIVIPGVSNSQGAQKNVLIGDSRLARGFSKPVTAADITELGGTAVTNIGNTFQTGDVASNWRGPAHIAQFLSGGLVNIASFASSGSRLYPVSGRTDDMLTVQYPAAKAASQSDAIITILSSVNDRSGTPGNTVENTISGLQSVVRDAADRGRRVEIVEEYPTRANYWLSNAPADWARFVSEQRRLATEYPDLVALIKPTGFAVAAGVAYPQGHANDPLGDEVHPRFLGAWKIGKAIHESRIARGWIPSSPVQKAMTDWKLRRDSNLMTNYNMTGSTAGVGGGTGPATLTTGRTVGNSWDKSYVVDCSPTLYAVNTAYVAGNVVSSADYPDYDYLCITGGTSGASAAAMSQTVLTTTADNGISWLTIPKIPEDFYGVRGTLFHGAGTADVTKAYQQIDIMLASVGLAPGDTIEASVFFGALKGFFGAQICIQPMLGASRLASCYGMAMYTLDQAGAVPSGTTGRLMTQPFVIPATADRLRINWYSASKNGLTQASLFAAPELRKI